MGQVLFLCIALVFNNYSFSQTTEKVISKSSGKEMEISNCISNDAFLPVFYFEVNSTQCINMNLLETMMTILIDTKLKRIILDSHCSDQEFKINPAISLERALEIKNLMKGLGYDPNTIEIKDVKNTQPVDWTGDHKENQRVEIILLSD